MNAPNPSEELVANLCGKSFLSLWSYPMTQADSAGKELCDVLVVCDPDIIIISIKEIGYKETGNKTVDWQRWQKKAIENSCRQIYGAERYISTAAHIITKDGQIALPFPDISRRRVHRVAVALGSQGKVPLTFGDFGKGFVHVFDEQSLDIIMKELDTITDFTQYLIDKEKYLAGKKNALYTPEHLPLFFSGEEDMLAVYLRENRIFTDQSDIVVFGDDNWKTLVERPEWNAKKEADRVSYVWDNLIEMLINDLNGNGLISDYSYLSTNLTNVEQIVRVMARENRFSRRLLAEQLTQFLTSKKSRARIVSSLAGVQYVFLASQIDEDRQDRVAELAARCHVARGLNSASQIVIGIATENPEYGRGYSLDVILVDKPIWTEEDQRQMKYLQQECGLFSNAVHTQVHGREYPE